jgi:hypothetical protein
MYMSTIDLDTRVLKTLKRVLNSILRCRSLYQVYVKKSPSKGYHLTLWCSKRCLKCRRRWDDPFRLAADLKNRKAYQRDVLFDYKVIVRNGKVKILRAWK